MACKVLQDLQPPSPLPGWLLGILSPLLTLQQARWLPVGVANGAVRVSTRGVHCLLFCSLFPLRLFVLAPFSVIPSLATLSKIANRLLFQHIVYLLFVCPTPKECQFLKAGDFEGLCSLCSLHCCVLSTESRPWCVISARRYLIIIEQTMPFCRLCWATLHLLPWAGSPKLTSPSPAFVGSAGLKVMGWATEGSVAPNRS